MLRQMEALKSYEIVGSDGELGKLDDFFFDDVEWTVRELLMHTGNWYEGMSVLILPHSVTSIDDRERKIRVSLSRQQIEDAPVAPLDADGLLSRHYEAMIYDFYLMPYYWLGPYVWGPATLPTVTPNAEMTRGAEELARLRESQQSHLRRFNIVNGFSIRCVDGAMGDVEDMIFDASSWTIQYLVVDTRKYLLGKNVLVPPSAIKELNWFEATIYLDMTKADLEALPNFKSINDLPQGDKVDVVTVGRPS
jgi:hypothetical protein